MSDIAIVLVVILVVVILFRGPKALPQLGAALGRGIREARDNVSRRGNDDDPDADLPGSDPRPRDA